MKYTNCSHVCVQGFVCKDMVLVKNDFYFNILFVIDEENSFSVYRVFTMEILSLAIK